MRSRRREEKGKEEKNIVDEKGLSLSLSLIFFVSVEIALPILTFWK